MNEGYWEKFYKKGAEEKPTDFAKFVMPWVNGKLIYDVGAGNGRDSVFFSQHNQVIGVDPVGRPWSVNGNLRWIKGGVNDLVHLEQYPNSVIYSRFLIHAITREETKRLIRWSRGLFIAEFRVRGDKPEIYKNHRRVFWTDKSILNLFRGWELLYFHKGRGLAKFKDEDPLVVRIIARR